MKIFAATAIIILTATFSSAGGEIAYSNNVIWGVAPSGLAIGIAEPSNTILSVYLENRGNTNIYELIQSTARFILELNGKYYAMADYGGKSSPMPPGKTYGPFMIDINTFSEIPSLKRESYIDPNASHATFTNGSNRFRLYYKNDMETNGLAPGAEIIYEKK